MNRMKRANLVRLENGNVGFLIKSQKEKDTECWYDIEENVLSISHNIIEELSHPCFQNITEFESWCFRYIAEH